MTTGRLPPFTHVVWDDDLEKQSDIAYIIEVGQALVMQEFAEHAREYVLDRTMIVRCHEVMFNAVLPLAAGKTRGAHRDVNGDVEIGDMGYGTPFADTPSEFDTCSRLLAQYITNLDANVGLSLTDEHYEWVLRVACWLHGEIIRIHPFWNGNGRTARICMNYFAFRYQMQPIAIHAPRDYNRGFEYRQANRRYFVDRKTDGYEAFFGPMMKSS